MSPLASFVAAHAPATCPGNLDIGARVDGELNKGLVVDLRDVLGKHEIAERLRVAGRLGDADLVAEVGERDHVVLSGGFDQLMRRLVFHFGEDNIGRCDLIGGRLEAFLECDEQAFVEFGECIGHAELLAAIRGSLEEAIRLHHCKQFRLHDCPLLLRERGLGDLVAIFRLVAKFDWLTVRDQNVCLTEAIATPVIGDPNLGPNVRPRGWGSRWLETAGQLRPPRARRRCCYARRLDRDFP